MLFYGDELGYTNDYSYLRDQGKSYDNRWMHRPIMDWERNEQKSIPGTVEQTIFSATQKLISIRRKLTMLADYKNTEWLSTHNIHIAGFVRRHQGKQLFCLFNFSAEMIELSWYLFKEYGNAPAQLYDCWSNEMFTVGQDYEHLQIKPYHFLLLETR